MLQYLRGFFSFLLGLVAIGFVISKVSSCVTYGKMDGTDHLGDCHLPKVEAVGNLLAVTEKGVTRTSCVLCVRKGSYHTVSHPIMREWNCAINGYGHMGVVSSKDVVVEESFWKTKTKKEDVCTVLLTHNEWTPRKFGTTGDITLPIDMLYPDRRIGISGGGQKYTVISDDNSYLDSSRIYHLQWSIAIPPGFTEDTLKSLLRQLYSELEDSVRASSGDDIRMDLTIRAYSRGDNQQVEDLPLAAIKTEYGREPSITVEKYVVNKVVRGHQ